MISIYRRNFAQELPRLTPSVETWAPRIVLNFARQHLEPEMAVSKNSERIDRICKAAEAYFGEPVRDFSAPGGRGRASYRLTLSERSIIATLRPNFRRTHLEAFTLRNLSQHCDDTPQCLGVSGEIMFQSDVGGRRLNVEIASVDALRQIELAQEAVAAIFRVQSAGRSAKLQEALPHLGQNDLWVENFVNSIDALKEFSTGHSASVDRAGLCEMVAQPGRQFVKWDCRSGNAAVAADHRLRWFDFEYSGVRHGAEDIAWLIGDEAWPLSGPAMQEIVEQSFDPQCGHRLDHYLDYLALYLTFHCVQRLKLIVKEARNRGWLSKRRVRKYDDAGVHPEFAIHLCKTGGYFADRLSITAPIARDFEEAEQVFLQILIDGHSRVSA